MLSSHGNLNLLLSICRQKVEIQRKGEYELDMILYDVTQEIKETKKMLKKIDDFLRKAPEGSLNYKKVKDKTYYYQQISGGKLTQRYIRRKNEALARALAQKSYFI